MFAHCSNNFYELSSLYRDAKNKCETHNKDLFYREFSVRKQAFILKLQL